MRASTALGTLLVLLFPGCSPKHVKNLSAGAADGIFEQMQDHLEDPATAKTLQALTQAAVVGAMDGLTDKERVSALRQSAEQIVDALGPKLSTALNEQIGPALREQLVSSVHAALAELTSPGNRVRIEQLAAGVTGAIAGRLGPEIATSIRLDIGPAIGDTIQTDIEPAVTSLASVTTAAVLDQVVVSLNGPLRETLDHYLDRGDETADRWFRIFLASAGVGLLIMGGSALWLRNLYGSLHKTRGEKYDREQALTLLAGAIKNREQQDPETARALATEVKNLGQNTAAGAVIKEVLDKQPHLKIPTSGEAPTKEAP